MRDLLANSVYFGVVLTLVCYEIGAWVKRKVRLALATPLLVATVIIIAVLLGSGISYEEYCNGAKYITYFLTPATVCLAIPLYRRIRLLKQYPLAILGGIFSGVMANMVCIYVLAKWFGLNHQQYVTLLPKSITTAIGMGISEKLGGIVTLTVVSISITGILGNVCAGALLSLLRIREPVARGVAIGTASHALGTAKAMELGEIEGAMSSLSIVVTGVMTVIMVQVFEGLM